MSVEQKDLNMDLLKKIQEHKNQVETKEQETPTQVSVTSKVPAGKIQAMSQDDLLDQMASLWNIPSSAIPEAKVHANRIRMTHGMLASVPLLCKDHECPYISVCTISAQNRQVGQRCPMEAAALATRFYQYCEHFGLDMSNPTPDELIDLSLVHDLVEVEIQMMRASNRIAINGDFISRTIGSVDNKGKVYYEDTVDPGAEYNDRLKEKRWKIYRLLDSTRKDKASKGASSDNPSVKAASLFNKISEKLKEVNSIDVEYQEVNDTDIETEETNPTPPPEEEETNNEQSEV